MSTASWFSLLNTNLRPSRGMSNSSDSTPARSAWVLTFDVCAPYASCPRRPLSKASRPFPDLAIVPRLAQASTATEDFCLRLARSLSRTISAFERVVTFKLTPTVSRSFASLYRSWLEAPL